MSKKTALFLLLIVVFSLLVFRPKGNSLQLSIDNWAKNQTGDYGIVVRETTGKKRSAYYQADKQFVTASTYKLFLIYGILNSVEDNKLKLSKQVINGNNVTDCINSLLIYSDNECGWLMGKLIGWSKLDNFLHRQGYTNTDINNYDSKGNFLNQDKKSTASDEAELVWQLNAGILLDANNTEIMLSKMKRQIWRERIPAGVPRGIVVADKPGWLDGIQSDTGIVYGQKSTYVISIMSTDSTAAKLADLSKLVYAALN